MAQGAWDTPFYSANTFLHPVHPELRTEATTGLAKKGDGGQPLQGSLGAVVRGKSGGASRTGGQVHCGQSMRGLECQWKSLHFMPRALMGAVEVWGQGRSQPLERSVQLFWRQETSRLTWRGGEWKLGFGRDWQGVGCGCLGVQAETLRGNRTGTPRSHPE